MNRRPRARDDRGSVTVELAAALPAVVLVLGLMVAALAWARAGVEATQAAAVGARIAAVEGAEAARTDLARALPHASTHVSESNGRVEVRVVIDGPAWLPGATATSVARKSQ